jgi:glycine cleavage system aminomethyltransferase T/glycine/D-amino acid oxidase-like deaminating enzyme
VVVGGGVGGASIAFHLTELGWTDTVLVERDQLTSGSTFHSAGLVGQLRSSVTLTRMMMEGVELYRRLLAETGHDPGWHEVGSLRLASTPERMEELARQAGWAATFGLPLQLVSTAEAHDLFHGLFDPADVLGAVYLPTDGHLNPSDLCMALAAGARTHGAEIATRTRVIGFVIEERRGRRRVTGVVTDRGTIECDVAVIAGGIYAHELGALAGITIPTVPMAHQYAITRSPTGPKVPSDLPTMRDPDRLVYFREEVGGMIMGGYERDPMPWSLHGCPADFNNRLLDPDWDRFLPLADAAQGLVPWMVDADVVQLINGPEAFTPDGEFILGESAVDGLFVAAGFCAHGIAGAGGVGKVMAEWIDAGEPTRDLWKMDIRRFGREYASRTHALARTGEVYATYYDIAYPNHERSAGRPLRVSLAYAHHVALDAVFGEKAGWERVNWYASNEDAAHERLRPRGWAGQHWSTAIVTEAKATRTTAGLFDETSFGKFELTGSDALGFLQWVCANDVDRPAGTVVYTQLLNRRGGIECDLTIARIDEERWWIVTGTAFGLHDRSWIERHIHDRDVHVRDITSELACFALWGPAARAILGEITDDDLSFGFMRSRPITLGSVPCRAARVTYVGEHGWELYAPSDMGARLWSTLLDTGRPHGLVPGGYRAIESLRLEKGYRAWGSDISNERDPISAGLGFAVKLDKGDFLGRDALLGAPSTQRLVCLVLDDVCSVALGNEPVRATDGAVIGRVTSGGLGAAIERSIAYAWMPAAAAAPDTRVSVDVFGERIGATVVQSASGGNPPA